MRRTSRLLVFVLMPLALSLTSITATHASTPHWGTLSFSTTSYSAQSEPNGDKIYDAMVTVNWEGPLTGTSVSYERDTVYPNGTVDQLGTGTYIGSFHGEPPGSLIDNYTGSFTDPSTIFQNVTLNDAVTFSDGTYGLTGLHEFQVTEQAQSTSCSFLQTLFGQQTTCIGTGKYALYDMY